MTSTRSGLKRALYSLIPGVLSLAAACGTHAPGGVGSDSSALVANCNSLSPQLVPYHPFLADSPWPIIHANTYAQASSAVLGLDLQGRPAPLVDQIDIPPLVSINPVQSGVYPDCSRALWYATNRTVGKASLTIADLKIIDQETVGGGEFDSPLLEGAYTLIDRNNRFFVPRGNTLLAFQDQDRKADSASHSPIEISGQYTPALAPGDLIVGLSLTYDGFLVYGSEQGTVGIVDRGFANGRASRSQQIQLGQTIRNSLAVDEKGGIYVVTNTHLHRIQWTGRRLSQDPRLGAWSEPYSSGRNGSGSTPTLMGTRQDLDQLVVITDGESPMNLVAFWRDRLPKNATERLAGQITVPFPRGESQQTVVVSRYGALVVNNTGFTTTNPPVGIARFNWDPLMNTWQDSWQRLDLSVPNGVPLLSATSEIVYVVGFSQPSTWSLDGLDWNSGSRRFSAPYNLTQGGNSLFAATTIGDDGAIIHSTVGGIIRWRP